MGLSPASVEVRYMRDVLEVAAEVAEADARVPRARSIAVGLHARRRRAACGGVAQVQRRERRRQPAPRGRARGVPTL
jgi:hypothetical protein